jgi:hypothetical protein
MTTDMNSKINLYDNVVEYRHALSLAQGWGKVFSDLTGTGSRYDTSVATLIRELLTNEKDSWPYGIREYTTSEWTELFVRIRSNGFRTPEWIEKARKVVDGKNALAYGYIDGVKEFIAWCEDQAMYDKVGDIYYQCKRYLAGS